MAYNTIISCQDLAAQLNTPHWVILDCQHNLADFSWGKQAYLSAHIPQAQFVDVEAVMAGDKKDAKGHFRGRHPLPAPEVFIDHLRQLGINDDTQVIIYDTKNAMFAARLWWMFKWIGHDKAAVLDGGLSHWQAQGLPVTTEVPAVKPAGSIQAHETLVQTVDLNEMISNLTQANYTVVDARATNRFHGQNETVDPVAGHIPHARNRFFEDNLQADGTFKSAAQLKQEWAAFIQSPAASIMQCGSGSSACQNLLALEIAGLSGAKLYPGSWSEWSSYPELPVATTED